LKRFLCGDPIKARPLNTAARLARWSRRNPVAAGLIATSVMLLIVTGALAVSTARTLQRQLQVTMQRSLSYSAEHVAHTVSDRLNELGAPVMEKSRDRALAELMEKPNVEELRTYATPENGFPLSANGSTETTWILLDAAGTGLMRLPTPEGFVGENWQWRDYVRGCVQDGKWIAPATPYISRPYYSRLGNLHKFAIVAPIYDRRPESRDQLLGLVARTFATDADLGVSAMNDEFRQAVVVALDDPDTVNAGADPRYRIIVHPAYRNRPGEQAEQLLPGPLTEALEANRNAPQRVTENGQNRPVIDDEYIDPLTHGEWMAAMTPVPRSPFSIIIQEPADEAVGLGSIALRLVMWIGIALGLAVTIMSTAVSQAVRAGTWRKA
jgi:hypothetical protein